VKTVKPFILLKLLLAGGSLTYLIHHIAFDQVYSTMTLADPFWIGIACLLLPANLALEAWKWHTLLSRTLPHPPRFSEAFGSMMSGYALGLFTPARVGDYAGRAFYLKHANKWELAALTLTDRLIALVCYVVLGLAALIYFLYSQALVPAWAGPWMLFGGVLGGSVVLYLTLHPRIVYNALNVIFPFERIHHVLRFLKRLTTQDVYLLLAQSTIRYVLFSTQYLVLIWAFVPSAPIFEMYVGITLVFFAKTVIPSVTLMDLGIREGASVYFLGALGIGAAAAFDAAFLLFCVNLVLPAFIGIPFLMRLRFPRGVPAIAPTAPHGLADVRRP
jgi:uncharacterized membrane protein YbhN (UPF0104 family)